MFLVILWYFDVEWILKDSLRCFGMFWELSEMTGSIEWNCIIYLIGADNRCFLNGGGSTQTFFVSEDAAVGSTIGTTNFFFFGIFLLFFVRLEQLQRSLMIENPITFPFEVVHLWHS